MSGNISEKSRLTEPAGMGPRILPVDAVRGFTQIAVCSGKPIGVPADVPGQVPMVFDKLNRELYVYSGAWIGMNQDFYLEVQKGRIPGHSIVHKFGRNTAVANATWEGVHPLGGLFVFLSAATTMRVKAGGNSADTAAGAGAQVVTLEGMDGLGARITEDLFLDGATASAATSLTFLRTDRTYVADGRAGAYGGANIGTVVIEDAAGNNDMIEIEAGEGQSQYCAYSVPIGKKGYVMEIRVQADSQKPADFRVFTRERILDAATPFGATRVKMHFDGVVGQETEQGSSPLLVLPALTDIWIEAEGDGAQTEVSADMEILLVDN